MGNCCTGETKDKTKPSVDAISITDSEIFAKSASDREPRAPESPKEKRWQSTRRSPPRGPPALGPEDHAVLESWIRQKKASAVAATNSKRARAATAKLSGAGANSRGRAVEEAAAVMIQSAFRSYLARKALRALKGLVKVQALVRGHLVRKRTTATIQRMQSLATVQARARAQRTRMADESNSNIYRTPSRKSTDRRSRQSSYQEIEGGKDENIRIVEMDLGVSNRSTSSRKSFSGHPPQAAQTNRRGSTSSTPNRAHSKQEFRDLSVKPSPLVQSRPRAQSMRYDDYYVDTAKSSQQSSPRYSWSENPSYVQAYQRAGSYPGQSKHERRDISLLPQALVDTIRAYGSEGYTDYYLDTAESSPRASSTMSKPEYPSAYAENTEPLRVKKLERSLSAPKTGAQKLERSLSAPKTGARSGTGASGRKKATQAGPRPDSNVDPWLAKLARVSGADQKRNRGSSRTSHTKTVHGRSRGAWKT